MHTIMDLSTQGRGILCVMTQPKGKRPNWDELPPADWAEQEAHRVATAVERLRGKRSAQWLANKTKELGHEVTRSVIADLENGRRRYVTTAEIVMLAAALNTAPVLLLYPHPSNELSNPVAVWPHVESTGLQAVEWFSGNRHGFTDRASIPGEPAGAGGAESARLREEFRANTQALRLWRQLEEVEGARAARLQRKGDVLSDGDREMVTYYESRIQQLRDELGLSSEDA